MTVDPAAGVGEAANSVAGHLGGSAAKPVAGPGIPPTCPPAAVAVAKRFYAVTALWTLSGSLIWGINTLFQLEAGLTLTQAFGANAVFAAAQVLFEVPTGIIADTRGRRLSVLLGVGALVVGTLAMIGLAATAAPFWQWAAVNGIVGLAFALYSGATEAWFVDAYHAAGGDTDGLDGIFARSGQVASTGMLVGTIAGGALGTLHLSVPFAGRAILLIALGALAWRTVRDDGFDTRPLRWQDAPGEMRHVAMAGYRGGLRHPVIRPLMLLGVLQMGFLIWGWYAWQPHFLDLAGSNAPWIAGVIAAAVSLSMIAGNQVVRQLGGRLSKQAVILVGTTGLAAGITVVGLATTFWPAVAAFLVAMVCFGIIGPARQALLHAHSPSSERATILSFDGLMSSGGGIGSQVGLARVAQLHGYAAGYLVGGAALWLGVPIAWWARRRLVTHPPSGAHADSPSPVPEP